MSAHNAGCATPYCRLDECQNCWPIDLLSPIRSPQQNHPASHPTNAQTYLQAAQNELRSHDGAQHQPPHRQRQQSEREVGISSTTEVPHTYQFTTIQRTGPNYYHQLTFAQQMPSDLMNSGAAHVPCDFLALDQLDSTSSNAQFPRNPANLRQRPSSQQDGPELHPSVQPLYQYQSCHYDMQRLGLRQQLNHGIYSGIDPSTPNPNSDPANVALWNSESRVPGDRTIPRIDPASMAGPKTPMNTTCSPSETSSGNRRRGTEMYNPSFPFKCFKCLRTYNTQADLNHHIARVHSDRTNRPYKCTFCSHITFNSPRELRRHLAGTHNNPFGEDRPCCRYPNCKYEKLGFARRDHRDRHERKVHRGDDLHPMSRSSSTRTSLAG